MKKLIYIAITLALILSTTACNADLSKNQDNTSNMMYNISSDNAQEDDNRVTITEDDKTITVIDDSEQQAAEPSVNVVNIDQYENMQIFDWLDEHTVIVSKENDSLPKMSLTELSDTYPRSLYLYNLESGNYELLKAEENLNLSEASLSPDKKHLLYSGNTLGDPSYFIMDLDGFQAINILGANSAKWADNETVTGASYNGGVYSANVNGEVTDITGLQDEALFIVQKVKDKIYYNTQYEGTLMALDPATGKKTSLGIENVYRAYPAPDGNHMLVLKYDGPTMDLLVCDTDGKNQKTITDGMEISGLSWSPDQQMIAYYMKSDDNGTKNGSLYVYDMLTGQSTQIAVGVDNATTCWSPSGKQLAYIESNDGQYSSSVIQLEYSLQ